MLILLQISTFLVAKVCAPLLILQKRLQFAKLTVDEARESVEKAIVALQDFKYDPDDDEDEDGVFALVPGFLTFRCEKVKLQNLREQWCDLINCFIWELEEMLKSYRTNSSLLLDAFPDIEGCGPKEIHAYLVAKKAAGSMILPAFRKLAKGLPFASVSESDVIENVQRFMKLTDIQRIIDNHVPIDPRPNAETQWNALSGMFPALAVTMLMALCQISSNAVVESMFSRLSHVLGPRRLKTTMASLNGRLCARLFHDVYGLAHGRVLGGPNFQWNTRPLSLVEIAGPSTPTPPSRSSSSSSASSSSSSSSSASSSSSSSSSSAATGSSSSSQLAPRWVEKFGIRKRI